MTCRSCSLGRNRELPVADRIDAGQAHGIALIAIKAAFVRSGVNPRTTATTRPGPKLARIQKRFFATAGIYLILVKTAAARSREPFDVVSRAIFAETTHAHR